MGILDDVIVYSATPQEHVAHVRNILGILRKHQLYAKIQKCEFSKEEMTFVGFQVSKSGFGMDPAKVATIMDWPTPKNIKEVQSFLGFSNFYRKFILHYNTLTSPLTSLTRKGVRFIWSPAANAAFRQLQRAFTGCPDPVALPDRSAHHGGGGRVRLRPGLHPVP